jgi:hypothetical protein
LTGKGGNKDHEKQEYAGDGAYRRGSDEPRHSA